MKQINKVTWEIPATNEIQAIRVFATSNILEKMQEDRTLQQARNIATLPGVLNPVLVMPDGHEGYGFPIGGVAAFPVETGLVSPGGIGYDINCGIRLLKTNLFFNDVKKELPNLVEKIFKVVPSGLGSENKLDITRSEFIELITTGLEWTRKQGYSSKRDNEHVEEKGIMDSTHETLSQKAISRGFKQIGTLGAGNHFVEVQRVDSVFSDVSKKFGLKRNQVVIMIHTGSRGFGYQIASEYISNLQNEQKKFGYDFPDKELVSAPLNSEEGRDYLEAMKCAVNFAFVNRQMISFRIQEIFSELFGETFELLYDVTHNIGKFERHRKQDLFVHRKGATRAFGPKRKELPKDFRLTGQPVLIPGSMGTSSYVLVGKGFEDSFESTCHGAGRILSRSRAKKEISANEVKTALEKQGISLKFSSNKVLAEEAPLAYKDIDEVVRVVETAGISDIVAKLKPIAVVKG